MKKLTAFLRCELLGLALVAGARGQTPPVSCAQDVSKTRLVLQHHWR